MLSVASLAQTTHQSFVPIKNNKAGYESKTANLAGRWKGTFHVKERLDVPFLFEVTGKSGNQKIYFINGEERFYGGKLTQLNDSIHILLDQFDNELVLKAFANTLTGFFAATRWNR